MEKKIVLDGISVCLGMPSMTGVHSLTVRSLFASQALCLKMGIQCDLAMTHGNSVVQWARDEIIDLFLQSSAERLFFLDSDIVWEANDFMRLLAFSQERGVVCASYTAKTDDPTFYIRYDKSKPFEPDEFGLVEIQGAGLGFTVVRREIIEKVVENSPKIYDEISDKTIASVFKIGQVDGNRRGEDMAFFEKINDLGFKIYMDPSIELGHVGTKVYRGKAANAFTELK